MTPRTVVFALGQALTVEDVVTQNAPLPFSRIPIYDADLDAITGYVLKNEVLRAARENKTEPLRNLRRPMVTVPGDLPLHDLFERLMRENVHIALVVDDFGGTEGVVTLEDFIETLLGLEIVDEVDTVEDMRAMAREQWRRRARNSGLIAQTD
jgi:CBS domain containing-hemolysin-like protein